MQARSPIFSCHSLSEFLRGICESHPVTRRKVTVAQWAKRLGYRSPSSLYHVIREERLPSAGMVRRISDDLRLTLKEHRYFELLAAGSNQMRSDRAAWMFKLNPSLAEVILSSNVFQLIYPWYHFAIKQLIDSPSFREDPTWIRTRLRNKVTVREIRRAIDNLIMAGLVHRENGKLNVCKDWTRSTTDIPDHFPRTHIQQMNERGLEALEEQSVEEREFDTSTLRLDPKRIGEMKKFLREMREEFSARFEAPNSDQVYQFNYGLFRHTK